MSKRRSVPPRWAPKRVAALLAGAVLSMSAGSSATAQGSIIESTPHGTSAESGAAVTSTTAAATTTPVVRKMADFTGDGVADIAVWRPSTGVWYVKGYARVQWGQPGDIPVPADYDGDGKAEYAVWRPSTGIWWIKSSINGGIRTVRWGIAGDIPVPGDAYECGITSGRAVPAVWRPSTGDWWIGTDLGVTCRIRWGQPGDVPHPDGGYALDSCAPLSTLTVWRPSEANFYSQHSVPWATKVLRSEDIPLPPVYGTCPFPIVWRPSTGVWYTHFEALFEWGQAGDVLVPGIGGMDGPYGARPAVWRPSTGRWWVYGAPDTTWGLPGDIPV